MQEYQRITGALRNSYDIDVLTIEFLPLGADMNASVYKVQGRDQKSYFVKLKRNYRQDISIKIAWLLHESGLENIILPIKTVDGEAVAQVGEDMVIVYPFIQGEDGFKRDLSKDQWIKLGKALRQIHQIEVPDSLQNQIRKESFSNTWRVRVRVRAILSNIHKESNPLAKYIQEHQALISKIVERAEKLREEVPKQSPFVLCHSDIHGGNVLIDEKGKLYIVDWDDPIMAPKERDLMFIGGGVGNLWNKPHEEEFFFQGYGSVPINKTLLTYYRFERIVVDIAEFHQESMKFPNDERILAMFQAMFATNGVVDIAFQTDGST